MTTWMTTRIFVVMALFQTGMQDVDRSAKAMIAAGTGTWLYRASCTAHRAEKEAYVHDNVDDYTDIRSHGGVPD